MTLVNKRILIALSWTALVLWMLLIFTLSATAADESNEQSGAVCHVVASLLVPGYAQMDDVDKERAASQYQHVVRKSGHASEYALLGVLSALACCLSLKKRAISSGALAWFICLLYATSDEIHQLFVPGRSCQISDVAIDATGALLGVLLVMLLIYSRQRLHKKNSWGQ